MLLAVTLAGVLTVGDLRLCGERVISAVIGDDGYTGQPSLIVTLSPQARGELGRLTGRLIGRRMPIRLGRIELSRPRVEEAILGGVFSLSGPDLPTLERARAAALAACPAAGRRRTGT